MAALVVIQKRIAVAAMGAVSAWNELKRVFAIGASVMLAMAAPATALEYHEVTDPTDEPQGIVLVAHGGAWVNTGPESVHKKRPVAQWFANQQRTVWNVTYGKGSQGLPDLIAFYDAAVDRQPGLPVCAYGESAGGHLALLLSSRRPVDCVIAAAAPTDLMQSDPQGRPFWPAVYAAAQELWLPTAQHSPARIGVPGRILAGWAMSDMYVPPAQIDRLQASRPDGTYVRLKGGGDAEDPMWVHSKIDAGELERWEAAMAALLASVSEHSPVIRSCMPPHYLNGCPW